MRRPTRGKSLSYRGPAATLALLVLSAAGAGQADGPMRHVHFEPDPAEDLRWGATTARGRLPAALDTPSGMVPAPGEASRSNSVYGGAGPGQGVDAAYQIDRLTTQPDVVRYDDPFSPSVAPFKRLFAFDRVGENLELAVRDARRRVLEVGGSALAGEDAFFGDVQVELIADTPVRIPSVAPGARLLALHTDPAVEVAVEVDGAGNWFAVGKRSIRARLLMQLSVPRAVFGSRFAATSWDDLREHTPALPARVQDEADRVLERLGVSRHLQPAEALERLVAHFRSFAPSAELPAAASTEGLYEELALSRKGVCRHRSYAFVVTAHRLGLPTRFVHNEAHAWVEVFDGRLWHRIDLGGAAGRIEYERPLDVPLHRPPSDAFPWPARSNPGAATPGLGRPTGPPPEGPAGDDGAGPSSGQLGSPQRDSDGSSTSDGHLGDARPEDPGELDPGDLVPGDVMPGAASPSGDVVPEGASAGAEGQQGPPSTVTLELGHGSIRRGHPLRVMGRLEGAGGPCGFGRVDFALRTEEGRAIPLGSLPTDARGVYAGEVVVPPDVPVGEHGVEVTSPGAVGCGPSR